MKKSSTLVLILLCFSVVFIPQTGVVKAENTIYIKEDGSIEGSDKIHREDNVYTLTSDINFNVSQSYGIKVETENVVLDGGGYTIRGGKIGRGIEIGNSYDETIKKSYNVTVRNITVEGFENGIFVFGYWGNIIDGIIIAGNNFSNNEVGIRFSSYSSYSNNIISGNNISHCGVGISMEMGHHEHEDGNIIVGNNLAHNNQGMSFLWLGDYYGPKPNPFYMNNHIYKNNFICNNQNVVNAHIIYDPDCANIWNSNMVGNFWSNYNGTDNDSDGIGDTPYVIDENNQDNYPLMKTVAIETIPEFPTWIVLPLFLMSTLTIAFYRKKVWRQPI